MNTIRQHLSAGQLQEAIDEAQQALRQAPGAHDLRAMLVELLCLAGQLERADDVLSSLTKHHPDWIPGAANLRQLLRAQHARLALREGRLADDVVAAPCASLEALVTLNLHLSRGELEQAAQAAEALEAARVPVAFQAGDARGEVRDCDDSLGGYVEGLGTDGRYYLWQWNEIQALRFHPPASPVELVWRRADLELADGRQGEAFLPLTYAGSDTDALRLGRETGWREQAPGLVTGAGLKLFLVGDQAVTLSELRQVERCEPAEALHAG